MAFQVPDYRKYYDDIINGRTETGRALKTYYETILQQEQGDVDRAKRRLGEDYERGFRINTEDYDRSVSFARESAGASYKELQDQAAGEEQALQGDLLRRGVSQGGLAEQKGQQLKSRQDLRREAVDRALKKSEEDLRFGKERGLEEETIKQKRGSEDLFSSFAKFKTEKDREMQDKALGLAEQEYSRDFAARSTQESFRLQQEGLDLSKKAMG